MSDDLKNLPSSGAAPQPSAGASSGSTGPLPPSAEVLKAALKAFKKRLKIMQLDDESRIGRGPMSSGQKSTIAGITAPDQYPREVWEELVKQGKLKNAGRGLYMVT